MRCLSLARLLCLLHLPFSLRLLAFNCCLCLSRSLSPRFLALFCFAVPCPFHCRSLRVYLMHPRSLRLPFPNPQLYFMRDSLSCLLVPSLLSVSAFLCFLPCASVSLSLSVRPRSLFRFAPCIAHYPYSAIASSLHDIRLRIEVGPEWKQSEKEQQ